MSQELPILESCRNKISMGELHDKFYELCDKMTAECDARSHDLRDTENDFSEVYNWFVHYGCQDADLKRAEELYDYLVYKYEQFNTA
jgi:hypothetical protein